MRKIFITGNPSSGTTFMIGLLTRLGLDTGFTEEEIEGNYSGLEVMSGHRSRRRHRRNMWKKGIDISPQVIKHPFGRKDETPHILKWKEQLNWDVERVIIMIRDVTVVQRHREELDLPHFNLPHQDKMLRMFLHEVAENEWPLHLISFPRAAQDVEYCWKQLQPLSGEFEQFKAVWERHVRPEEIHP